MPTSFKGGNGRHDYISEKSGKGNLRLVSGVVQASTGWVGECWQPWRRRFLHRSYFIETLFRSLNCTIWGTLLVKARIKALNNWIDNYTQGCRLVLHRAAGQHRLRWVLRGNVGAIEDLGAGATELQQSFGGRRPGQSAMLRVQQ